MYLSRIKLNTSLRKTMQALAAPNLIHGAIEDAELLNKTEDQHDNERNRKLWRIDRLNGEWYLLVLSQDQIDFSPVANQFSGAPSFESKNYDGLINRVTNGSMWHFRIKANPIVRKPSDEKGRGKIFAHTSIKYQEEWLKKQSVKNGFSLSDGEWLVTESKWYNFKKNKSEKQTIKLLSVTYEGILCVVDEDAFKKALKSGIGREKAYGLGLMTIVGV